MERAAPVLTPEVRWTNVLVMAARILYLGLAVGIIGYAHLFGLPVILRWSAVAVAVVLVGLACWRRGGAIPWLTLLVGVMVFLELRGFADNVGFPVHTGDLVWIERTLFLGIIPTNALQALFFVPGQLSPLDQLSAFTYWSYFFVPYAVAFVIWLRRPKGMACLAHLLVLTFVAGIIIYALMPGTPPWLASFQGEAPQVYRIMRFVGSSLNAETYDRVYKAIGDPNPIACLPSVHFALTFMLFLYSLGKGRWCVILAALYSLAMVWTLVYLGEHYVIDCVFGAVVAWGVWYGYRKLPGEPRPHGLKGVET